MLTPYVPILILLALATGFSLVSLGLSDLLGRLRPSIGKSTAYECGMQVEGSARLRLSIHFYLVAVLFILFDVESLLLVPWAVAARSFQEAGVGPLVLAEVAGFVGVLGLGLAWVWKKGGLDWDR
ncbi:MAG: NADH-quinone oxidoreductase subunit A [Planctomycetes bacterium]|nr:NADH-quinone oxidoreductase subunit A [Planctomycetota bacterium]